MLSRVDAHCHLWRLDRGDYGWLDPADPGLASIARDFEIGDLAAPCVAAGISHSILVQAAPTVEETAYLLSLAGQSPLIAGVVGWVDLSAPEAAAQIEHFNGNRHFKGVRPMLQDLDDADWIATQPRPDAVSALQTFGLRFDALVLPQHLGALLRFAQAYPDLPIVIDHAAKPALAASPDDPRHEMWRDGMMRLADETDAYCKMSGLLTELSTAQCADAQANLQPVIDDLLDWFGAKRLMWGSDWPVLTLAASHADWAALSDTLLSGLDPVGRARVFAGTAQDFYGIAA
ncbi:MAG: amidohydrolase family protein [Albidovulum sp.]